jgi:CBS domain-containing protein
MYARDVMTAPVVTAQTDTTVYEIANMMIKHHISAIPIVSAGNEIVGIVSEGDLLRRMENDTARTDSWWLATFVGKAFEAEKFIKAHGVAAKDVMTEDVLVADEDTSLGEIAELLEKRRIKRLPIVRDGVLVGIVSRANLVQAIIVKKDAYNRAPRKSDTEIRSAIMEVLSQETWPETRHLNLVVTDGIVHLWGIVSSETQAQALRAAVTSARGVKSVVDNMKVVKVLYSIA